MPDPDRTPGYRAYRCMACNGDPAWTITRLGDVATTWSCNDHLDMLLTSWIREHDHGTTTFTVRQHQA